MQKKNKQTTKEPIFRTTTSYVPEVGEVFNEPTKTVPHQVLSLEEYILKFKNGIDPNVLLAGDWDEIEDFDKIPWYRKLDMDLVDMEELSKTVADIYQQYEETKKEYELRMKDIQEGKIKKIAKEQMSEREKQENPE